MKSLKFLSMLFTLLLWAGAFSLAAYGVIPYWAAILIGIAALFLGRYVTLWIVRSILGGDRFADLVVKARSDELQTYMVKEDEWKADLLAEHRRIRSLQNADSSSCIVTRFGSEQIVWTRVLNPRCLVTEHGDYWAQVMESFDNKVRFLVHEKGHFGHDIVCQRYDCETEQEAMEEAAAFMLHPSV